MLENGFLTAYGIASEDLGRIFNGPKLTDFDQKAWAIAHGFEQVRFWKVPTPFQNNFCGTCYVDLGWIRKGRKLADFEQKAWAIAHAFEHGGFWQVLEIAPNSLKRLQIPSKIISDSCGTCYVDLGWIRKGRKSADFEQKAWAIAHAFEHGGFWQVLEIAPNSLKRLQIPSKIISDSLRDLLCRFGVNSQRSKIGRFWAKSLGYSPCFWTWRILASPGNRSKLSETPPNPFQNNFWLFAGLVMSIWGEFARVENWPILSKKPGL